MNASKPTPPPSSRQDATYSVRVVGRVHGRSEHLAIVQLPDGTTTRVQRWLDTSKSKRSSPYRCDEHGFADHIDDCPHTDLAEVAWMWQAEAEKEGVTHAAR